MVRVNPIRTEEDYDAALTRISEIFHAEDWHTGRRRA